MDYKDFIASLTTDHPPKMDSYLTSLWYDRKGEWEKAHNIIDPKPGKEAARIHAYLHRKEGDKWNADYWYRQAGTTRPHISLEEEWDELLRLHVSKVY